MGFEDDSGSIECAFDGADGDDAAFTCTVTVAGLDDVIVASVLGLEGSAPGVYPILNGGLGVVDIGRKSDRTKVPRSRGKVRGSNST